jgi:hypothetical protein
MAPELQRDQLGTYERLAAEYGDVVRLVVGPPGLRRELYLVTHPDGVQQVLAGDPELLKNTPYYDDCRKASARSTAQVAGGQQRRDRRAAAFAPAHYQLRRRDGEVPRAWHRCSVAGSRLVH